MPYYSNTPPYLVCDSPGSTRAEHHAHSFGRGPYRLAGALDGVNGGSGGGSCPRSQVVNAEYPVVDNGRGSQHQQPPRQEPSLTSSGEGTQYLPQGNYSTPESSMPCPLSPTTGRLIQPQRGAFYPQQTQRRTCNVPDPDLNDLGKGVPLSSVPASRPLYIVEFKAGRTDRFYLADLSLDIRVGDLVVVETDWGKDMGIVVDISATQQEGEAFERDHCSQQGSREIKPKMIHRKAQSQDRQELASKAQDESKALQLCQNKVRQKKLSMEIIDAEYQWFVAYEFLENFLTSSEKHRDRRKLTFYFIAEKRIDFRELVQDLFRFYNTRICMVSLQAPNQQQRQQP
ncbi:hypothetical protein EDC04DRAFT_952760 [Pisolithus marmoratus]|nr:hypothetical protein EDC04DRAFT_952760 [Pisolithus marmoratus]